MIQTPNPVLTFLTSMKMWRHTSGSSKNKRSCFTTENVPVQEVVLPTSKEITQASNIISHHGNIRWDREDKVINLQNSIEFLHKCKQAANKYSLNTSNLAQEYLLKARYREDRENFFNSFRLEQEITFL